MKRFHVREDGVSNKRSNSGKRRNSGKDRKRRRVLLEQLEKRQLLAADQPIQLHTSDQHFDNAGGALWDHPPVVPSSGSITISDASGTEGDILEFTVTGNNLMEPVTVTVSPEYLTASSADLADFSQSILLTPLANIQYFEVQTIDDELSEPTESFVAKGEVVGDPDIEIQDGNGTINDNDEDILTAPPSSNEPPPIKILP